MRTDACFVILVPARGRRVVASQLEEQVPQPLISAYALTVCEPCTLALFFFSTGSPFKKLAGTTPALVYNPP